MRVAGVRHVVGHLRTRGLDRPALIDLAGLALHVGAWIGAGLFIGWLPVLGFYLALWGGVGVYLGLVFLPAPMGLPIVTESDDPVRLTLATARDFRLPRWAAWFISGLDHQEVHHLWPRMPHRHLHRVAPLVREDAERRGLTYHRGRWPGASPTRRASSRTPGGSPPCRCSRRRTSPRSRGASWADSTSPLKRLQSAWSRWCSGRAA